MNAIAIIANFVHEDIEAVCTAHDFAHIQRVVRNAQKIIQGENNPQSAPINELVTIASCLPTGILGGKILECRSDRRKICKITRTSH
ncbi:MAG: hypothetical protein NZL83_00135 [Candidatus Absconditabacterales bacterium]|nr:hypothetical protein [Candidatus Absconditabacterales bacterium]